MDVLLLGTPHVVLVLFWSTAASAWPRAGHILDLACICSHSTITHKLGSAGPRTVLVGQVSKPGVPRRRVIRLWNIGILGIFGAYSLCADSVYTAMLPYTT
jgi:hypothetical protein